MIKKVLHNSSKYALLFLAIVYLAGSTMFTHTHVVNGTTVIHFLPCFNHHPTAPHQHSHEEKALFNLFHHTFLVDTITPLVLERAILVLLCVFYYCKHRDQIVLPPLGLSSLRAPPIY